MPATQLNVGVQNQADGAQLIIPRAGRQGDQIVSELHGRYYEQGYRGNIFNAANQAVVTTTVGLATTYTGLCLSNPRNSKVNVVLNKCSWMQSVLQATQVEGFALALGFSKSADVTHTTPVTPSSNLVGSGLTSQANVDASATLPIAPVYSHLIGNTATATQNGAGGMIDLEGSVILIPGAFAIFATPTQASVAGMWFGFQWEEVPV